MTDERPLILLVGAGARAYCEYLLALVARQARVWLLTHREPTWERPYLAGHTRLGALDAATLARVAQALHARRPVSGVLTWDEVLLVETAEAARALDLPGGDPAVARRCRDKHLTRRALAEAGVPSPASELARSPEEARAAAARIGWPVVVKPRALSYSLGVRRVDAPEQLDRAYDNARAAAAARTPHLEADVLVEEYLEGPEISCDACVVAGRLRLMTVARKQLGFAPHFEEVGHTVDARDPLRSDPRLLDLLARAHQAVGFRDGVTHTELRLTAAGPRIVEINGRTGGDLIPYLGHLATGIDPGRAAVLAACGQAFEPDVTRERAAGVHFFYPSRDLTVARVEIDRAALPASLEMIEPLAPEGRELRLPPAGHVSGRYALAVASEGSLDACRAGLRAAAAAIRLHAADGSSEPALLRAEE